MPGGAADIIVSEKIHRDTSAGIARIDIGGRRVRSHLKDGRPVSDNR